MTSRSGKMRAAVIGVGAMGRNHARIYAELEDVELVAVADQHKPQLDALARIYGVRTYASYLEMLANERLDLVSVVVPTRLHAEVACAALRQNVHVLVEKPLAGSREQAHQIIDAAAQAGCKLAVGHVERFNPAVIELKRRLESRELGRIFQVHARRLSPYPGRIQDVGVVLDLATHDIDVMRYVLGTEVERVYAEMERKMRGTNEDLVSALLRFRDGVVGVLDVNWLTPTKVRQLSVLGEAGMYVVDYLAQDVCWYRNAPAGMAWDTLGVFRGVSEGDMIKVHLEKREPLRVELESFVACVRDDTPPRVSGLDGLQALEIAERLIASGRDHQPLELPTVEPNGHRPHAEPTVAV